MVCLAEDDFTAELQSDRRQALWQARLSDGTVATMDDGRPGASPHSAWVRLGEHCRASGLAVESLWLKFRSNAARRIVPDGADGYFFCKSALGMLNSKDTFSFFLVGYLRDSKLVVQRWQVPELILVDVEERDPDYSGHCLIRRPLAESPPPSPAAPGRAVG